MSHTYRLFGLSVESSFAFPELVPDDPPLSTSPRVSVQLSDGSELERRFSGASGAQVRLVTGEDEAIDVVLGRDDDAMLFYGDDATFYVSRPGDYVLCAPADATALAWQRVLLDTVLCTAALCRGLDGLHAGAVALAEGVVAISAPPSGGKSTLCAELIRQGGRLFADDLVFLTRDGDKIVAHPGPPLMNLPAAAAGLDQYVKPIARFGDEVWAAVTDAARAPAPLRTLIILDRRQSEHGARLERVDSPTTLLSIALDSGPLPARRRGRFELLGDLARTTRMSRLVAGTREPPTVLAELVREAASES